MKSHLQVQLQIFLPGSDPGYLLDSSAQKSIIETETSEAMACIGLSEKGLPGRIQSVLRAGVHLGVFFTSLFVSLMSRCRAQYLAEK